MTLDRAFVQPLMAPAMPAPTVAPRTLQPIDVHVAMALARESRDAGDLRRARGILEDIVARDQSHASAWNLLATVYRTWGMYAAELGALQSALEAQPDRNEWLLDIAQAQLRLGLVTDAEETLQRAGRDDSLKTVALATHALMHNPKLLRTRLHLAQGLADLGMQQKALDVLSQPAASAEHRKAISLKRATLLRRMGRIEEAREAAHAALLDGAPSTEWWAEHFEIELASGEAPAVAESLKKAPTTTARERADLDRIHATLAEWRWSMREAAGCYESAAAQDRQDPRAYEALARLALTSYDIRTARHQLARIAALRGPGSSPAGDVLEAFLDNPALQLRLANARLRTPQKRLYGLMQAARANPRSTAAALAVLFALREAECFDTFRPDEGARIPRRVIQYWHDPHPPEDIGAYLKSWKVENVGFKHAVFDDRRARAFLGGAFGPQVLAAYDRAPTPAMKSDLFRLAYVHERGGFFASSDDVCRLPIASWIPLGATFVASQGDYAALSNSFFGAVAGNKIIKTALDRCVESLNRDAIPSRWLATGGALLSRAFVEVLAQSRTEPLKGLAILDRPTAMRGIAMQCAAGYKTRR